MLSPERVVGVICRCREMAVVGDRETDVRNIKKLVFE